MKDQTHLSSLLIYVANRLTRRNSKTLEISNKCIRVITCKFVRHIEFDRIDTDECIRKAIADFMDEYNANDEFREHIKAMDNVS